MRSLPQRIFSFSKYRSHLRKTKMKLAELLLFEVYSFTLIYHAIETLSFIAKCYDHKCRRGTSSNEERSIQK